MYRSILLSVPASATYAVLKKVLIKSPVKTLSIATQPDEERATTSINGCVLRVCLSQHSTTPTPTLTPTLPTRLHPYVRHARFPEIIPVTSCKLNDTSTFSWRSSLGYRRGYRCRSRRRGMRALKRIVHTDVGSADGARVVDLHAAPSLTCCSHVFHILQTSVIQTTEEREWVVTLFCWYTR